MDGLQLTDNRIRYKHDFSKEIKKQIFPTKYYFSTHGLKLLSNFSIYSSKVIMIS